MIAQIKRFIKSHEECAVSTFPAMKAVFMVAFLTGIIISVVSAPDGMLDVRIRLQHLSFFFLSLLSIVINGLLLKKLLQFGGIKTNIRETLRESASSSLASVIPVFGTVGYKYLYLRSSNMGSRKAIHGLMLSSATFVLVVMYIGVLGFKFAYYGAHLLFGFFLALAVTGLLWTLLSGSLKFVCTLIGLHFALLGIEMMRLRICFDLLNSEISFDNIAVLQIANLTSIVGSASPGGIGVKELGGALLAWGLEISPGLVFVAFSLNRIIGLIILTLFVTFMTFYEKKN